ncbi:MAG: methylthioribulose-1-phosphate dehydratase [Gammaproteobacteria bacterium]|nr:MAG: methylthioribulose-1-phosphate dehydratase [Gammaproteobacteria bacterium]
MGEDREWAAVTAALAEAGAWLYARGLVPATSGNFSARLADGGLAITVSGRHKGRLGPRDFLRWHPDGRCEGEGRPSAEFGLHRMLYARDPAIGCVLHPHSPAATVLSRHVTGPLVLAGYELLKAFPGIATHATRLLVPVLDNDQDIERLAGAAAAALDGAGPCWAFLIRGHGYYTWGRDAAEALRHVEALEFLFECELRSAALAHR